MHMIINPTEDTYITIHGQGRSVRLEVQELWTIMYRKNLEAFVEGLSNAARDGDFAGFVEYTASLNGLHLNTLSVESVKTDAGVVASEAKLEPVVLKSPEHY
jgi:hypothetical protein